ncbi:MAG TPA: FtsX-like permease family protein [Methanocella sp.]
MIDTRFKKALRDLWFDRSRTLIVIAAIAIGLFCAGTVIVGYSILDREMSANYVNTNPASAIFYVDHASDNLAGVIKNNTAVQDAELRSAITARVLTGPDTWQTAELFVIDDFNDVRVSTMHRENGSWPAGKDQILFERVALPLTGKEIGDSIIVETDNGIASELSIVGTVHDPGLAPANMEGVAYGYISKETLADLGGSSGPVQLLVVLAGNSTDEAYIKDVAYQLKTTIEQQGSTVLRIEIPPPGKHPHAGQMTALLFLFEAFGALAFILSMILVINLITGLLAQQVRQIGVMKAVGATTGQVMAIYLGGVCLLGAVATAIALPASVLAGQTVAGFVAGMLNFDIFSNAIPSWVFATIICAGLLLPVLAAAYPVYRGSRITVHQAINDYGISNTGKQGVFISLLGRIPGFSRPLLLSLRNTFRRKERMALTLLTLSVGGALLMVALSLSASMDVTLDNALDTRNYNDIIIFASDYPAGDIASNLSAVPGVDRIECLISAGASLTFADGTDSNKFTVFGVPPETDMIRYPVLEGRWLQPGDQNAIVLNHMLMSELAEEEGITDIKVGGDVTLDLNGKRSTWHVAGIVREMMAPARAYVNFSYFAGVTGREGLANTAVIGLEAESDTTPDGIAQLLMMHGMGGQKTTDNSAEIMPLVNKELDNAGMNVSTAASISDMRLRMKEHLAVIAAFITFIAGLTVVVGGLGLASAMSINLIERRREIGIMRAIGASARTIVRLITVESLVIGLLSWLIAVLLAQPLSYVIGSVFGTIFFKSPLDIAFSHPGMILWLALVVILAPAASLLSARKAAKLPVNEVLAYE